MRQITTPYPCDEGHTPSYSLTIPVQRGLFDSASPRLLRPQSSSRHLKFLRLWQHYFHVIVRLFGFVATVSPTDLNGRAALGIGLKKQVEQNPSNNDTGPTLVRAGLFAF
jgi:hypothetical protein